MRLKTKVLAATLGFAMIGSTASAITVYAEDFDRANSNTVGNGWSELSNDDNDVRVLSGHLFLRDNLPGEPDAAAVSSVIDLTGLHAATLSFDWISSFRNEVNDVLNVAWTANRAASSTDLIEWTSLGQFSANGSGRFSELLSFGAGASDQLIRLMFWTDVSDDAEGTNEGFWVDNINVAAVPLPAGAPLLLAGLAGLGLTRRRRDRSNA